MRCSTWPRSSARAGTPAKPTKRLARRSSSTSGRATRSPPSAPGRCSGRGGLQPHRMPPPDDPLVALRLLPDHRDGHREALSGLKIALPDTPQRQPPLAVVDREVAFAVPQERMVVAVVLGHLRGGELVAVRVALVD